MANKNLKRQLRKTLGVAVYAFLLAALTVERSSTTFAAQQGQGVGQGAGHPDFVEGRILARFRSADKGGAVMSAVGATIEKEIGHTGVFVLRLPNGTSEEAVALAMSHHPDVEFAEVDRFLPPSTIPNDPLFPSEWHLATISAPSAWDTTVGNSGITVAILDTGVDGTHPDLASKLVPGWNFYDNNANTSDVYGHGTEVAGTVAAVSNNGAGVSSLCWNCMIMPVRISDTTGYALYSTAAQALTWAADHGARVANISYEFATSSTVASGAQYFQNHGGVVTISAGNDATVVSSPDNPYVLTVSATDTSDNLAYFSNQGTIVDVAAPGVGIYTTTAGGGYGAPSGTSFSAPIVAGVAALVLSANPNLTGSQARSIIERSADDLGSTGWDPVYGYGRVNAANAVAMAVSNQTPPTAPPTVSFASPQGGSNVAGTISVAVNATDANGIASVSLNVDGANVGTATTAPYTFYLSTTGLSNTAHTLTATAADAMGKAASASIAVTVNNVPDTIPPVAVVTSPANGATLTGNNVTLSGSGTDNIGVVKTELYLDGVLKAVASAANVSYKWNTKSASKGAHTVTVKAYDAAANVGSASIAVYK